MERCVSVRLLNQQTSSVLKEVEQGQAITITRAGRPIARILPCVSLPSGIQRLVEAGRAVAPTAAGRWLPPDPTPGSHIDIAAEIAREREQAPW